MVCQGPRCGALGSVVWFPHLIAQLEEKHVLYYKTGGSLRVTASTCLGGCSAAPVVLCYYLSQGEHSSSGFTNAWFGNVSLDSALDIALKIHNNQNPTSDQWLDVVTGD